MQYDELPQYWKDKLSEYIQEKFHQDRKKPDAADFQNIVMLRLHDGSHVYFKFAFYIINEDKTEIAVFTEHCGYHVFPFFGADVELLSSGWTDMGENTK